VQEPGSVLAQYGWMMLMAPALASSAVSAALAALARDVSLRLDLLDRPNHRSSHQRPKPRLGGLGILAAVALGLVAAHATDAVTAADARRLLIVGAAAIGIGLVSLVDDLRGHLHWALRLAVHVAGAAVVVALLGSPTVVSLPGGGALPLGMLAVPLAVVWIAFFTNAFNFMDGIDGIAGVQAVAGAAALAAIGVLRGEPTLAFAGAVVGGAALGFLLLNWPPASIFMGDVGSALVGTLLAALPLTARDPGPIVLGAVLALAPFVFDAAFTLTRRVLNGENFVEAHRQHLYQRLTAAGWSHRRVTLLYAGLAAISGTAAVLHATAPPTTVRLALAAVALSLLGLWVVVRRAEGSATTAGGDRRKAESRTVRNRFILLADIVAILLSVLGAFVLRLDWFFTRSPEYIGSFQLSLIAALLIKPPVFLFFGLYQRYWKYAGVRDLLLVILAESAASALLALVVSVALQFEIIPFFPRSILAIDWLLSVACLAGIRLSVRLIFEPSGATPGALAPNAVKRVLVAGAGDAGALVVREMHRNPQLGLKPVGYLDDNRSKVGKRIYDVPVVGLLTDIERLVTPLEINEVVIAMPRATGGVIRSVVEACQRAGVASKSVPGVFELLEGGVSVSRLRQVDIADLLRRAQVQAHPEDGLYLQGRVVLVTGAGGSIGSELSRQVARARASDVVLVGHGENSIFDVVNRLREAHAETRFHAVLADVRDARRIRAVVDQYRPSIVFHAAAHKHVPLMEAHPQEAVTNNVLGTRNVVDAAVDGGVARLVLISTDKAVAPSSVMGASKRIAELIVRDAARQHERAFSVVRFGNVLGSRGSVVPFFKQQIERGGPVTITHPDMTRFFMTIPEAVHLVLRAGGVAAGGELFVLNMGDSVRIVDLAQDLIRLSGFTEDEIPIVYTGLRAGEKLQEQLWEPGSSREPAGSDEVFRVTEPGGVPGGAALAGKVDELLDAAARGDVLAIHKTMTDVIPTFVSSLHLPERPVADGSSIGRGRPTRVD
jgi:FlaA1/EpsC-like NDP-sugar epimerase/UDP-N-acetylmuramyl pentapeptide phosphotransferase/UDP-N-acetylglucosamine-1-phosphate transferase